MVRNGIKTALFADILLFLSWAIEAVVGAQVVQTFWSYPLVGGSLASTVASVGNVVLKFLPSPRVHLLWTSGSIIAELIEFYVWFHIVYAFLGLFLWPRFQRWMLGVRRPSQREIERFEVALSSLMRPGVAGPRRWMVADGPGIRMRWIGYVLVVDRLLLTHRYLVPLLSHEMGHANSEDRLVHRLFATIPDIRALVGSVLGLPAGCGLLLLYPGWMWYWRERVYAADAYAVELGQGYALMRALSDLYLPLDKTSKFGRWLKPVPYVELRIHRIQQVLGQPVHA